MSDAAALPNNPAKPLRSDGAEARNRLLDAALALFAEKGFAKTSTREIALAAQANIASISYYFGDKEGLYRAVFQDPRNNPSLGPDYALTALQDVRSCVEGMLRGFVEPLKSGEQARQCMKLHFREMVEPTGMWQVEIERNIKPAHEILTRALAGHLGLTEADDDIHRLAFQISGLGIMLHVGMDVVLAIRPSLISSAEALDTYLDRLVDAAMALVDAETRRRQPPSPSEPSSPPSTP